MQHTIKLTSEMKAKIMHAETLTIDIPESNWISVQDKMPKNHTAVMVHCPNGMYRKVYSAFFNTVFHTGEDDVTHWQPLPEPPTNES